MKLPSHLLHLTLGNDFNHSLEGVAWPALKTLILGHEPGLRFGRPMKAGRGTCSPVKLPCCTCFQKPDTRQVYILKDSMLCYTATLAFLSIRTLQSVTSAPFCNNKLVLVPNSKLWNTEDFNQSLKGTAFPPSLEILKFGESFNQPLDAAGLSTS